ncbi:MAG: aldehyde dehydrogenase family protein [Deltaproteobacteria bacterium]|nr:aldehyde dehydrogenase family protein [Deltaproteobacteria bacterium]
MSNVIEAISPATFESLGTFPIDDEVRVNELLDCAWAAFESWKNVSLEQRGQHLLKVRELVFDQKSAMMDEISEVISKTTGKPQFEALTAEIIPLLDFIPTFVKRAPKVLKDKPLPLHLLMNKKSFLTYEPYGVVAILSPWNYPFSIPMGEIVLALLAGNTVVVKTSEAALPVAAIIKDIFELSNLPKGVVNILFGDGKTGAALVSSPKVRKISFTGSTHVGQKILEQAAPNITPCLLELGGKDASIVCHDADLKKAARGIVWGAFSNAGQVCASVQRVYVVRSVAQEFIERVIQETEKLKMKSDIGAITLPQQIAHYEKQLEEAVRRGAKILVGGTKVSLNEGPTRGRYFLPTVLIHVTQEMAVMKEETFGPLLPIMMVESEEEALRLANDSSFGLCASIWTKDVRRGISLARKIQAGVQPKHINYDRIALKPFWWFPYTPKSYQAALAFAEFIGNSNSLKKLKALVQFLKNYLF